MLRERTGEFMRHVLSEASGYDGDPELLGARPQTSCSRDACAAIVRKAGEEWRLLATRSATRIDWATITRACAGADVVVSDRRLARGCLPRWLKLDRIALQRTGGVAIYLGKAPRVDTVANRIDAHPWAQSLP